MDDDIDVFAELGVEPSSPTTNAMDDDLLGLLADAPQTSQEDPLAALVEDDEADAFTVQPEVQAPSSETEATPNSSPASDVPRTRTLSTEMVGKVIALLVQRGLAVDPRRLGLPSDAVVEVAHVDVHEDGDVLIARAHATLNGAPMHPFAAVTMGEDGWTAMAPPHALPEGWHAMHDVLAKALMEGAQQLDEAVGGSVAQA